MIIGRSRSRREDLAKYMFHGRTCNVLLPADVNDTEYAIRRNNTSIVIESRSSIILGTSLLDILLDSMTPGAEERLATLVPALSSFE